jgi:hypothetical protein
MQNVSCSNFSFQNVFSKNVSVFDTERIDYEQQTELVLKNFLTDSGFVLNKSIGQRFISTICYKTSYNVS